MTDTRRQAQERRRQERIKREQDLRPDFQTLQMDPDAIRTYLDGHIDHWRRQKELTLTRRADIKCDAYLDAYQGIREALFGERLR